MLLTNIPPVAAAQLLAMAGSAPLQAQALSIDPFVRDFCLYVKYVKKKKERDSKCLLSGQRHMNQLGGNGLPV